MMQPRFGPGVLRQEVLTLSLTRRRESNLLEIKEHVNSAWQWISKEGPLCEENMRGVRMNIVDVTMHADTIHRGAGQIAPPMRRCSFAALMTGTPTLQEPVFLVEITCPQEALSGVYSCMNLRRGCVFEENERE